MYSTKYTVLFTCIIISLGKFFFFYWKKQNIRIYIDLLVLLWCTNAESSEQQDRVIENSDEEYDDMIDVYRRASLRPVFVHQRASLRPTGKRASLRPVGKRASLRPFGKRASLHPPIYFVN